MMCEKHPIVYNANNVEKVLKTKISLWHIPESH
jgi:hypothetical protein